MPSQTIGVRFPGDILRGIDAFKEERGLRSRNEAIVSLITIALRKWRSFRMLDPSQDRASGQRARAWGLDTSRKIATILGAEPLSNISNEFDLDGELMTIRCAKPKTVQVGLTNRMRDRVAYVVAAFQANDGHFNLFRVTPSQWEDHAREASERSPNYGRITFVTRATFQQIGEDLGEVEIEVEVEDNAR